MGIDDGGGKMSPEEAQKEAQKAISGELSQEAREFYSDDLNAVLTDVEKTFPLEPKYKDLTLELKQFLKDLTPSIISDKNLM